MSSKDIMQCDACGAFRIRPGSVRQANPLVEVGFCEQCGKETRVSRGTWACDCCHQSMIRVDTIHSTGNGWFGFCEHCSKDRHLCTWVRGMSGDELFSKLGEMASNGTPIEIATRAGDDDWDTLGTIDQQPASRPRQQRIDHDSKTISSALDAYFGTSKARSRKDDRPA